MMMFTLSGFDHKSFLEKSGPKIQTCLFKVKVDTKTNSNMQNSMVVSILCFRLKTATLENWYLRLI